MALETNFLRYDGKGRRGKIEIFLYRIFDRYFNYGYKLGIQGYSRSNVSFSWMGYSNYQRGYNGWLVGISRYKELHGKDTRWD